MKQLIVSYALAVSLALVCCSSASARECDWNKQIWKGTWQTDPDAYQELQFVEGLASGAARITEYRKGRVTWVADGEFMCSNGASICYLEFAGIYSKEPFSFPYEVVTGDKRNYVVVPAFRQSVYSAERYAMAEGLKYAGLKVELVGSYMPAEGDLIVPMNVYAQSRCLK